MARLFVGLKIPDHIAHRYDSIRANISGIRWQKPENFHITLSFIGNIDAVLAKKVEDSLRSIRVGPFRLSLSGIGTFSRKKEPKILWAGVPKQEALARLKDQVDVALDAAGLSLDKKEYVPHMTLAAMRGVDRTRLAALLQEHENLVMPGFEVSEFILYQSIGTRDGQIYKAVSNYPLLSAAT